MGAAGLGAAAGMLLTTSWSAPTLWGPSTETLALKYSVQQRQERKFSKGVSRFPVDLIIKDEYKSKD